MQEKEEDKEKDLRKFGWRFTTLMRQSVFYRDGRGPLLMRGTEPGPVPVLRPVPKRYQGATDTRQEQRRCGTTSPSWGW